MGEYLKLKIFVFFQESTFQVDQNQVVMNQNGFFMMLLLLTLFLLRTHVTVIFSATNIKKQIILVYKNTIKFQQNKTLEDAAYSVLNTRLINDPLIFLYLIHFFFFFSFFIDTRHSSFKKNQIMHLK